MTINIKDDGELIHTYLIDLDLACAHYSQANMTIVDISAPVNDNNSEIVKLSTL